MGSQGGGLGCAPSAEIRQSAVRRGGCTTVKSKPEVLLRAIVRHGECRSVDSVAGRVDKLKPREQGHEKIAPGIPHQNESRRVMIRAHF